MDIRPVQTEADYDAAPAEVEALWGAPIATPQGDRLDTLMSLIEACEAEHYPIAPLDSV